MITGDVLEIISKGQAYGQTMLNVYHMRIVDPVVPSGDDALNADVMADLLVINYELLIEDIRPFCGSQVNWTGIEVRNLFNAAELNTAAYSSPYVGSASAETTASFVNPVIFSTRKLYGMHGGRKALAPVNDAVSGSNVLTGGVVAALNVMVNKWNTITYAVDTGAVTFEMQPVVVKRIREETGKPKRPYTYRLPTTQAELVYYHANNWQVRSQLGSQNSRKPGVGN